MQRFHCNCNNELSKNWAVEEQGEKLRAFSVVLVSIRLLKTAVAEGQNYWKGNVEWHQTEGFSTGAGGCRVGWKTARISGMPMWGSGWWFLSPDSRWEKMANRLLLPHSLVSKATFVKQK